MPAQIGQSLVLRASIQEPLTGFWTADVEVDTAEQIEGAVVLEVEGVTFSCSVHRGELFRGRWKGRLVAGAYGGGSGGPRARVAAKFYAEGATLRIVLSDIAAVMGIAVDVADSDSSALDRVLGQWQRVSGPAAHAVAALANEASVRYHVTRAGLLRLAAPSYAELELASTTELLTEEPRRGSAIFAPLTPELLPDRTIDGRRCGYVVTDYGPGALRQTAWFED